MPSDFGALSLVPPLLAIALAIIIRRAMLSLFLGVWVGGIIYARNLGVAQTFEWIVASIGESTFHAKIIVFTLLLGAGIALIWRLGGSLALAQFATRRINSHRRVGVAAWLLGLIWNFDDYAYRSRLRALGVGRPAQESLCEARCGWTESPRRDQRRLILSVIVP